MSDLTANEMDYNLGETAVQEEPTTVERCLSFEVGDLVLFINTSYVTEIINGYSIIKLPMVPPYVRGMVNLRGQMLPVLDVRLCMGKPEAEYTSKICIIVLNIDSVPLGIIVDSVRQVLDIDFQNIQPIPLKRQQKLLDGMITLEDGTVIMSFDCNALLECRY